MDGCWGVTVGTQSMPRPHTQPPLLSGRARNKAGFSTPAFDVAVKPPTPITTGLEQLLLHPAGVPS